MTLETLLEGEIFATFLALALLLAGAYICGKLMEMIRAPKVIGEIIGGMLFGGTCLYHFCPELMMRIFQDYPEEGKVLNLFYQLGLLFLMFSSGFNTRIEMNSKNGRTIACVFVGATILPMLAALPFVGLFQGYFIGENGNTISFLLVFIIGVAITSIPVISKIFFDMGIMNTRFANIVLTVSTFQDLCLWILLNVATRMASTGRVDLWDMFLVIIFTLGMFVIAKLAGDHISGYGKVPRATDFYTVSFIALLAISAVLYYFGINLMYSAFLIGYIVKAASRGDPEAARRMDAVAAFSFSLFVPIYFALVGIQLNLIHNFSLIRFLLFFIIAFCLEWIGTALMLLATDLKKPVIINFAMTMNARGGPGIVLATVAYAYQIINVEFFTTLILTTMLSSLMAGYWLRYQQKKDHTIFSELVKTK